MKNNNNSPKSILIVEDDETLLQTLAYNLEREGYSVSSATDGQTGLELARTQMPDLIILDIMLPELDGLSVCRILPPRNRFTDHYAHRPFQ